MGAAVAIPMVLSAVGAGVSAYSRYQQGEDAARAAEANREITLLALRDSYERAQERAGQHRTEGSQVAGAIAALAGASGQDVGDGTAAAAQTRSLARAEADVQEALNNAAREAWGYNIEADQLRQQADQARSRGRMEAFGTLLGAAGTIGTQAFGIYQDWSKGLPEGQKLAEDVWGKGNLSELEKLTKRRGF